MRFVTDLNKGILGKPDSPAMWQEIIASIPDEVFLKKDLKILNVAFGHGTEADVIVKRMLSLGRTVDEIKNSMYLLDKYSVFTKDARRKGYTNIIQADFINWETDMKFDVVVGNPPYQNTHTAKRWPLWHQFISKATELSDKVLFVVPASLLGPSDTLSNVKQHLKFVDLDAEQYFNVGSTFCWFDYEKGYAGNTTIKSKDVTYDVNLALYGFVPTELSPEIIDMYKYLKGNRVWKRGEFHTSNESWKADNGITTVNHTGAQTLFTNNKHENINKIRVGVTLSGYPKFKAVQGEGFTQANFWTEFETLEEAKEFADYCNSDAVQKVLATFKWSGWNSKEVIQKL